MKTQLEKADERYEAHVILWRASLHLVQQFRLVSGTPAGQDNIRARKYLIECMCNLAKESVDHLLMVQP